MSRWRYGSNFLLEVNENEENNFDYVKKSN